MRHHKTVGQASACPCCPAPFDAVPARLLERHQESWFALHAGVPGIEVHRDPDITWMIQEGPVWSNAGTALRFEPTTVDARLKQILARYSAAGRGTGFWVDKDATPDDLESRLKQQRFRCRKYYPGMACDLNALPDISVPAGITFARLQDHTIYERHPHPYLGRISTPIRRHGLRCRAHLSAHFPEQVFNFVALDGSRPIGSCTVFLSEFAAGFHDMGVLAAERGTGVAAALMAHALRFARDRRKPTAVLLASGMGFGMYQRVGFREVCRIGYWYRA